MKSPYDLFMNIERVKLAVDYIEQELEKVTQHSGYKLGIPIAIEIPKPKDKSELNFIKSLYNLDRYDYHWRIEDDYDSSMYLDKCWLTFFWGYSRSDTTMNKAKRSDWKMAEVEK